jgi:signal transduction histidine kinase
MEQLQTIYEIDEKNSQIAELEKQNQINALNIRQHQIVQNIMIIGIVLALLISITVYWFYNQLQRKKVLNLNDVLQSSLKGLTQSAEDKQIDISVETNDQIFVLADPDMVQTIVRNIFSNAIKFTYRGGSILIKSALTDKNTAIISIVDNGVGIEKSKLTKIFEITNTHHTKGTENEKSTGLGLILVKDFVEKNKGIITIDSEKNKGTTVSFTLPTTQAPTSDTNL